MTRHNAAAERLLFLARIVKREIKHLRITDQRLFDTPLTLDMVSHLDDNEALAETIETFVSRFGRLQDTVGDKLLPHLLAYLGERPGTAVDNLDRAERLRWIESSDSWLETRKLRNRMVHEYIEDPAVLLDALHSGHKFIPDLIYAANRMLAEIETRMANNPL